MSAQKRVLCVDDHEDTCALVSSILEECNVIAEHSKAGGLSQAATEKFDLILIDYHLPDGTGLELCVLIRAFDPNTPILLVTCTHSISHEQVIAVGGQGVIRKDRLSHLLPMAVARTFEVTLLER
jgi:CheY-like chemotaxis protein